MPKLSNLSTPIQEIPYQPSLSLDLFAPIADLPWAMLLRSAAPNHPNNRFDILVARPLSTLETQGDKTIIKTYHHDSSTSETVSQDDPFALLQAQIKNQLGDVAHHAELPFLGGALGYLSYDLGRQIEKLPSLAKADPKAQELAMGIYDWALICDHHSQKAYLVGVNAPEHFAWLNQEQMKYEQIEAKQDFQLTSNWQSNMSAEDYAQKFAQVQRYIQSGDCYQINLTQKFQASYQGSEWQAYTKLEAHNHAPFSAFVRTEKASILSLSPERFILLEADRNIETKPIKGTRPRFDDPKQDEASKQALQASPKDQAENLMIVDLLRNDIGKVAQIGSVHVPHLFEIESFPAVHHLVSTIRAKLAPEYSPCDLLKASFPGGSITGAPKVRAMQIIEELEPDRRDLYCGSIGYISACGKMDTNICIRTLIARDKTLHVWAGGGLVADSECAAEYQETFDKLSKILPILDV